MHECAFLVQRKTKVEKYLIRKIRISHACVILDHDNGLKGYRCESEMKCTNLMSQRDEWIPYLLYFIVLIQTV